LTPRSVAVCGSGRRLSLSSRRLLYLEMYRLSVMWILAEETP
jgi:hypothetical protein